MFTAKANQPALLDDIRLVFENRGEPDFREPPALDHGRVGSRAIRTTDRLNGYLTFPHVAHAFPVERTANPEEVRQDVRRARLTTRLRRFAIGLIKARHDCIAAAMRRLDRHPRRVFDYLRMTENSSGPETRPARR